MVMIVMMKTGRTPSVGIISHYACIVCKVAE